MTKGKLYLLATPIGNLEDISLRTLRLLREADLVLCEDTRTSGVLLKHYEIKQPLQSYHKFNEHQATERIIEQLQAGKNIALISDAGTPGISDPGFLLARAAVAAGIELDAPPGATALIPALVKSGLPSDRFCFEGFLPQKKRSPNPLQRARHRNAHHGVLRIALPRAQNPRRAGTVLRCRPPSERFARNHQEI